MVAKFWRETGLTNTAGLCGKFCVTAEGRLPHWGIQLDTTESHLVGVPG